MLRSLHSVTVQSGLPQLLSQLPLPSVTLLATLQPCNAWIEQQTLQKHSYASSATKGGDTEQDVQQTAREMGLDALPLPKLRGLMASAVPRDTPENEVVGVDIAPPGQKRLTYSDVQGYEQLLQSILGLPETHQQHMPKAPALDAGQWVDAHFKQEGLGFEPRSGFYSWRTWAAAALPQQQYEALTVMEVVMADDNQRSALLKQAQYELARLWDWQHRRAALGLNPDLPPGSSSKSSSSSKSGSSSDRRRRNSSSTATEAAAAAVVKPSEITVQKTTTAATASSSSSSSRDDATLQQQQQRPPAAVAIDRKDQSVLDVLQSTGAVETPKTEAQKFEAALQSSEAAAAAAAAAAAPLTNWMCAIEDVVVSRKDTPKQAEDKLAAHLLNSGAATNALDGVDYKLKRGAMTAEKGKFSTLNPTIRVYRPVAHDDDLFLPGKPLGSPKVAAKLANPSCSRAVDPNRVVRQAVAIAESAKHAAALAAAAGPAATGPAAAAAASEVDGAEWTSMPLLDRTILHRQELRQQQARLAAKPKKQQPWQLLPLDKYAFDLEIRPPTKTLDMLTSYLEVKYADVLMRKDAVRTLDRQIATSDLRSDTSEVLDTPPAVLTAAKTLSPAEREALITTLDDLMGHKQYMQYKEAVLQLYCDGLISWGDLQQCWAAAQAAEDAAVAAEAPVSFADDRQQLFALLSGQQQLSLSSSSSSAKVTAADEAAARKAWMEAGSKLQGTWAAAAAAGSSSSSSSSSDAWADPISFEEAKQTWQQLLQLANMTDGPTFEHVLTAGSSSSSVDQVQLQQQLQQLQQALQQSTGLTAAAAVDGNNIEQLQQLFAAPPSLEDVLQQHWEQVSRQELGKAVQWQGPTWQQLWQLLQALTQQQQQDSGTPAAAVAAGSTDVTAVFDQYLREAESVPLTPPPYPGARRVLNWEQRIVLGATSGQATTAREVKVKLSVAAAELQQETGISSKGLQHMLAVAGSRYNPATGVLSLSCDRFPTREENRRWCLEVLHRLLQEGQARHPSKQFLLGSGTTAAAAAAAQF